MTTAQAQHNTNAQPRKNLKTAGGAAATTATAEGEVKHQNELENTNYGVPLGITLDGFKQFLLSEM